MLRASGAHEKEQTAYAVHELMLVVHVVVFPVGALNARNIWNASDSRFVDRSMERSETKPEEQWSELVEGQ